VGLLIFVSAFVGSFHNQAEKNVSKKCVGRITPLAALVAVQNAALKNIELRA
jgi:hypothetical protein